MARLFQRIQATVDRLARTFPFGCRLALDALTCVPLLSRLFKRRIPAYPRTPSAILRSHPVGKNPTLHGHDRGPQSINKSPTLIARTSSNSISLPFGTSEASPFRDQRCRSKSAGSRDPLAVNDFTTASQPDAVSACRRGCIGLHSIGAW